MRLISNGAICAVNAREKRRLEKFRAAQERKNTELRKDVQNDRQRNDRTNYNGR